MISIIAILAGITIIAINPTVQLGKARGAKRQVDLNALDKAGAYPRLIISSLAKARIYITIQKAA